jgi:D-lactate dehydrogenase
VTRTSTSPDSGLLAQLRQAVADPSRISDRAIDRVRLANDASHFLLTPQLVATPADSREVARILQVATEQSAAITFRAGGTSLSGQAATAGVLVDTRRHFRATEVIDDGRRIRVQPGVTLRAANARLAPYGTKLGPDPASEGACTIGGVVANNSSGMSCGTEYNVYRTLESAVVVLPSGTVIDTGAPDADETLRHHEPELHDGLIRLRDRVRNDKSSVATIERLFSMKNTMGYGINAFLDHDAPADLLAHLVVGSEGTLAFVAEATLRTIPIRKSVGTALLMFPDLSAALAGLPDIVATDPATVELLDASSLEVGQQDLPPGLRRDIHDHAALLLEYQLSSADELAEQLQRAGETLRGLDLVDPPRFTSAPGDRAGLWRMRKGLYAAVAGARPSGTMALLEDIVVPVPGLLETCTSLTQMFDDHGYQGSVIFGHAKDGNVHFMLNERFDVPENVERYHRFSEDLVALVLSQGGSLKAEHGTGRMMAPYVRRQYGDELYEVMLALKALFDPHGIMNPGVLISEDPSGPTRDLKPSVEVEPEVDRCVECGFCEPVCPSADLTTTPRQRIAIRRAMQSAENRGDLALQSELADDYRYEAVDTCAADGMCQLACPVGINTGDLVKRLRADDSTPADRLAWGAAARHWGPVTRAAGAALRVADRLPDQVAITGSRAARKLVGTDRAPAWTPDLPSGPERRQPAAPRMSDHPASQPSGVFFASCTGAMFGPADSTAGVPGKGVASAFKDLCDRAGTALALPAKPDQLCCGTPWRSKGMVDGYRHMVSRVAPALWEASDEGRLPVICDASSCTEGLRDLLAAAAESDAAYSRIRVVDATEFTLTELMPRLRVPRRLTSITLHPTCSSARAGEVDQIEALAGLVAEKVVIPPGWGCCGFAGDRGLLHPELTRSATQEEAREVLSDVSTEHASTNRTCELGMTRATGQSYRHLLEVVEEMTRE